MAIRDEDAGQGERGDRPRLLEIYARDLWDSLEEAVFVHDGDSGAIVDANQAAQELTGQAIERMRELSVGEMSAAGGMMAQQAIGLVRAAAAGKPQRFEWLTAHRDGAVIPLSLRLDPVDLDGRRHVIAVATRPTADKRPVVLPAAKPASPAVLLTLGLDGSISGCSSDELLDHQAGELLEHPLTELVHPSDLARIQGSFAAALGGDSDVCDVRLRTRQGEHSWTRIASAPLRAPDDEILGLRCSLRDVEEEHHAAERLSASETRYRTIFEAAKDAIFLMRGRRFLDCNAATLKMFGGSREQIVGRRPDELSPPAQPDGSPSRGRAAELIDSLGPETPLSFEWTHCRVDGTPFDAEVSLNHVEIEGEKHILAIVRDVTHRKLEQQRREELALASQQRQKLESLGTLAAGVAHEINNPLMGILNYAELLASRLDDETLAGWARSVVREGERVSRIVKNLLAFARQEKQPYSSTSAASLISGTLDLIGASLRHDNIEVCVEVAGGLPPLSCRAQQIQQILLNLLTNARDALNERFPRRDPRKELRVSARLRGDRGVVGDDWMRFSVQDQGAGVPPSLRQRIFDPFFTTKPCDRGTGLGLSISFGLARDHGGTLGLDDGYQRGSRFFLDLPLRPPRDTEGG